MIWGKSIVGKKLKGGSSNLNVPMSVLAVGQASGYCYTDC